MKEIYDNVQYSVRKTAHFMEYLILGARFHPNAEWNRKAGLLLADYLRDKVL